MKKKLCAAMLALLMIGSSAHGQSLVNETQEQKDKRMEWFHKAKLGIFIHWGVYSVLESHSKDFGHARTDMQPKVQAKLHKVSFSYSDDF